MSGGRWQYAQYKIEEQGQFVGDILQLLALIEHTLDWGVCGDTCRACAERNTIDALYAFFDSRFDADETAPAYEDVLKRRDVCEKHKEP